MSPDLTALLQDPARVAEVPREAIPPLLAQCSALQSLLSARLASIPASGNGSPEAPPDGDRLLTIPEVAARLGVPKGYAYELARRGGLPTVRFGKYVRVRLVDLQEWVTRHHEKGLDKLLMTGEELRRLRKRLGLTQAQLAERVGVTRNTIARQERGESGIGEPLARLIRLLAEQKGRLKGKREGR